MERTYTIPLRKATLKAPKYLRSNKAVKQVKLYLQRHMKTEDVKLGEELNKALWTRGDSKPPSRVTVFVKMEDNRAYAELAGTDFKKKDFSEQEENAKKETRGLDEQTLKAAADVKETPKAQEAKSEEKPAAKKVPVKKTAKK